MQYPVQLKIIALETDTQVEVERASIESQSFLITITDMAEAGMGNVRDYTCRILFQNAGGEPVEYDSPILQGNVLYCPVDPAVLEMPGEVTAVLTLSRDGVQEASCRFKFKVIEAGVSNGLRGPTVTPSATLAEHVEATPLEHLDGSVTREKLSKYVIAEIEGKVDKIEGKSLSTNDFSNIDKSKLGQIEPGAQVNVVTSVSGRTGDVILTKSDVGLSKADNTSDLGKPISILTQDALDEKVDKIEGKGLSANDYTTLEKTKLAGVEAGAQVNMISSVAGKTGEVILLKSDVGLSKVDNTSDLNKPISVLTQEALDEKVDKIAGKGLSANDYTTTDKSKLTGIEPGAQVNTVSSVSGKTGDIILTKTDVGLGKADNTSDLNKPISTATQTALDGIQETLAATAIAVKAAYDKSVEAMNAIGDINTILDAINGEVV